MRRNKMGLLVDVLLLLGWCLISAGAALMYVPAGLIAAGALAIAGGVLIGRSDSG